MVPDAPLPRRVVGRAPASPTRRVAAVVTALFVALGLLAVPGADPALAAYSVELERPADGSDVADAFEVVVRLRRAPTDPVPEQVEADVRLGDRVVASGPLECRVVGCGGLDPDGAPWRGLRVDVERLACNGRLEVEVRVDGADAVLAGVLVASRQPPEVRGLSAVRQPDGSVTVRWDPVGADDVRHVVQRRAMDGGWQQVGATSGSRMTDDPAGSAVADPEYRVVSERGDGRDASGRPVDACADTEPDLVRASDPVRTTSSPGTVDDRDDAGGEPDRGGAERDDDTTGGVPDVDTGDVGGAEEPADTGDGADGDGGDATDGGAGGTSGSSGGPPPPRRDRVEPPDVRVPETGPAGPAAPSQPDTFVPGGDVFEEGLDFGGVDPVTGEAIGGDGEVVGALQRRLGERVDLEQLWRFAGIGGALLAAGLGLRWWQRRPMQD